MAETRTACCYCGVGCGLVVTTEGGAVTGIRGDPDHPSSRGRLCTKGATLPLTRDVRARLLQPEVREARGRERTPATWDHALAHAARRFADIVQAHGPDAVAFYVSGQLLTEDYYVFNKLARALVGTNNIDTNSRLCMASAVAGYKAAFGVDAPPACYDDIERADCLFIAGANPAYAHPVLFRRIEAAKANRPGLRIIVADPRRTESADLADLHLAVMPGTDVALFNAMLHVIVSEGLADQDFVARHTTGFAALRDAVLEYTPGNVAPVCGVAAEDIVTAARWFGTSPAVLSLWCQGLNQSVHGTDKNAALLNLHLATGQVGRPGAGPLSLTGQPNAMGGREVGGMATALPGHRDPADPAHRAEVARHWGVAALPSVPGLTAVEMFEALRERRVKAVWIACTNPAQSMPHQARVREALEAAEFVVVQEAFAGTETAAYADVLLPATAWGEKDGTQTNSERTITRVRPFATAPGDARHDWQIAQAFALELGTALGRTAFAAQAFAFRSPDEVHAEHRALTFGRDLDITGLDYAVLDRHGPQAWPYPSGAAAGTPRLYTNGVFATDDGKARFTPVQQRATAERTDASHPLHLTTGRLRDQWHGMSRSGLVPGLYSHAPGVVLEMNADDMARRGLKDGGHARVASRRGALVLPVAASASLRPGTAFLPMHWGSARLGGLGVNALTIEAFDPVSRQPEFKHTAVTVEKLTLPWSLVAVSTGDLVAIAARLQPLLASFSHAHWVLAGTEPGAIVLRAAHDRVPPASVLAAVDAAFGFDACTPVFAFDDARRGVSRRVYAQGTRATGARVCGDAAQFGGIEDAVAAGSPVADLCSRLVRGEGAPPAPRAAVLCACFSVDETRLQAAVAAGADLAALQARFKCGTQCGSCLPALRRLVESHAGVLA